MKYLFLTLVCSLLVIPLALPRIDVKVRPDGAGRVAVLTIGPHVLELDWFSFPDPYPDGSNFVCVEAWSMNDRAQDEFLELTCLDLVDPRIFRPWSTP